jgi:hypothetical protein
VVLHYFHLFLLEEKEIQRLSAMKAFTSPNTAETLVLGFLLIYAWDFLYGFAKYKNYDQAYRSIRFEQEAYGNEHEENYLEVRKNFAWLKYKV